MAANQALTPKANKQLTELSDFRLGKGEMHLKKHIMAEAIEILYKREIKNAKSI